MYTRCGAFPAPTPSALSPCGFIANPTRLASLVVCLQDWYSKTPLGKKRLKAEEEKLQAAEARGKDKKKKKKK